MHARLFRRTHRHPRQRTLLVGRLVPITYYGFNIGISLPNYNVLDYARRRGLLIPRHKNHGCHDPIHEEFPVSLRFQCPHPASRGPWTKSRLASKRLIPDPSHRCPCMYKMGSRPKPQLKEEAVRRGLRLVPESPNHEGYRPVVSQQRPYDGAAQSFGKQNCLVPSPIGMILNLASLVSGSQAGQYSR